MSECWGIRAECVLGPELITAIAQTRSFAFRTYEITARPLWWLAAYLGTNALEETTYSLLRWLRNICIVEYGGNNVITSLRIYNNISRKHLFLVRKQE